ncbi:hypothetical protein GXSOP10_13435 [Armatimonadetes bacterium GXS]|nr:hypothetical protein GXSOP10_13435 [Armatimonadetes bacterium GXS]
MRWMIALVAGLWWLSAHAIPETVVLTPTANRNQPRSLYLATEQFAVPHYYDQTRTRCFYTQALLTDRFDFGVDFVGFDQPQTRQTLLNARLVLTPETERTPGVAFGVLNVSDQTRPTYYVVSTRTTSFGRFHVGGYTSEGRTGWSGAYQFSVAGFDGAVEYFRLPSGDAYTSFGVGRALNQSVYLYTYYSRHDKTRDADLFGVYIAFTPFRLF